MRMLIIIHRRIRRRIWVWGLLMRMMEKKEKMIWILISDSTITLTIFKLCTNSQFC